jgi:dATP/dGTP diphosphohydrolase
MVTVAQKIAQEAEAEEPQEEKYALPGGTTRTTRPAAFHLVPGAGLRRIAERFRLGAEVHGLNNWMAALETEHTAREFAFDAYNHMVEHAFKMIDGDDPEDDHLGAIGWAVAVLATAEEKFGGSLFKYNRLPPQPEEE